MNNRKPFATALLAAFCAMLVYPQPGAALTYEELTQTPQAGAVLGQTSPRGEVVAAAQDHILVKFKAKTTSKARSNVLSKHKLKGKSSIKALGIELLSISSTDTADEVVQRVKGEKDVEFAELDRLYKPQAIFPDDSYYPQQNSLWQIQSGDAWTYSTGSPSVIIAVVDSNVAANFDIQSKLTGAVNLTGSTAFEHGTRVAGVNAITNNRFAAAGLCWGCRVMPVNVADSAGNALASTIASGITYAAQNGAKVINLGYAASESSTVQAAAQTAFNSGSLVVAPVGNEAANNVDNSQPGQLLSSADTPYIVTVGSVDYSFDTLSPWSNRGNILDLVAGNCGHTTEGLSLASIMCGTSYSSALVSGLAGLLFSFKPALSPTQVEQIMESTAQDLGAAGYDTSFGNGRINAYRAMQQASSGSSGGAVTPNDPYFNGQTNLTKISAPGAWAITTGSASTYIAIVDTGVDTSHVDFTSKILPGRNIYDNNTDARDAASGNGHGTLMAGIAAANTNNSLGVAGVCWGCAIMPVRVSAPAGASINTNIASGIRWAADNGAKVIVLGSQVTGSTEVASAAQYAVGLGAVVVAPAGDFGSTGTSADDPNILEVGSTDANDAVYSWSNKGPSVDLTAPGGSIYTTIVLNLYGTGTGSAYAASQVGGVAALLKSMNPSFTPAQITSYIKQSTDPVSGGSGSGTGRLNALRALQAVGSQTGDTQAPVVSIASPANGSTVTGVLKVSAQATDNVGVVGVQFKVDGNNLTGEDTTAPYELSWNVYTANAGSHTITAVARDAAGNTSQSSITVIVPTSRIPNDPDFYTQSYNLLSGTFAWGITTGVGDTIALIDSGVYAAHTDLAANLVPGWNFINNSSDTSDTVFHGTYMAGVLAEVTNNGSMGAGTCWNCKVMPLKVTETSGTTQDSQIAQALAYAKDRGIKIAVLGYGNPNSSVIGDAARQFADAGGIVIMGAGNDSTVLTGTDNADLLVLSAIDSQDALSSWSNSGSVVDMSSLGSTFSTTPGSSSMATHFGSSYAAAYTAGTAALIKAANPACTGRQISNLLRQNAEDIGPSGYDTTFGTGKLNMYKPVAAAGSCGTQDTTPPTVSITSPANGATVSGTVNVTANAADNVSVSKVEFLADNVLNSTDSTSPYGFSWGTTGVPNGSHTLTARAYDGAGNTAVSSVTVTVNNVVPVQPPVITSPTTASGQVNSPFSYQITATNNPTSFGANNLPVGLTINTSTGLISGTPSAAGTYTIGLSATNSGGTGNGSVYVTISSATDTTPPTITYTNPTNGATLSGTVTVTATATDNVSVNWVEFYRNGSVVTSLTSAPYTYFWDTTFNTPNGTHTLTAKAFDSSGNMGTTSITVTVDNTPQVGVPVITSPTTANGTVSSPFSYQIVATNNPTSFGAANLPVGLTVNSSTGLITGTPAQAGSFTITLSAINSGGTGTASLALTIAGALDTQAPTAPTNLNANASTSNRIDLSWTASTDNVGVTGYQIVRNGTLLANTAATTYADTTVQPGLTYTYTVKAYDAAGNYSPASQSASATTPVPSLAITSYAVTSKTGTTATIRWTTNVPSTGILFYGKTSTTMTQSVSDNTLNTTHTITLTGLTRSTIYYYQIQAFNEGSTQNAVTSVASFKTTKSKR